jgi:Mg/Co/Ni transporter MgtE
VRTDLERLLAYEDDTAGSVMTTTLVSVTKHATVSMAIALLAGRPGDRSELDGVLVVDDGVLVGDVSLFDLLLADRLTPVADLVARGRTATVHETAALADVVEIFIDSRGTSVVVVDDQQRPVGRILADDVIDALLEDRRLARRAS